MRRQVTGICRCPSSAFSGRWLSPRTRQILPSQADTMASLPSAVKSKPVKRIRQNQGLSFGRSRTSTANGPESSPTSTLLANSCGQRGGPPCVMRLRSLSGWSITSESSKELRAPAPATVAVHTVTRTASGPAGIRNRRLPPSSIQVSPWRSPVTPAKVHGADGFGESPLLCPTTRLPWR